MLGERILNYIIISEISKGNTGSVYLARHNTLDRKAVIKVLPPELADNPEVKARFINEAKTLCELSHPNIVTIYNFIDYNNNLCLITEYAEGTPLNKYLDKSVAYFNEKDFIRIFSRILDAFDYAHRKGVIHCNIKPSNIVLLNDLTPKVLNFGFADIIESNAQNDTNLESIKYMSPEQILGKAVDYRSDIYSLGVLLFEMLTGVNPYNNLKSSEIRDKIVNYNLPLLSDLRPILNPGYQQIIERATAKQPEQRFESCAEFLYLLRSISSNKSDSSNVKTTISDYQTENVFANKGGPKFLKNNLIKIITAIAISFIIFIIAVFYIISDINSSKSSSKDKKPTKSESINRGNNEQNKNLIINEARDATNHFLSCWSNKDIICLEFLLADDYQYETATGNNKYQDKAERLSVWRKQFKERNFISVSAEDININVLPDNTVRVSYKQLYVSDKYSDSGIKVLYFRKQGTDWKIYRDSFY